MLLLKHLPLCQCNVVKTRKKLPSVEVGPTAYDLDLRPMVMIYPHAKFTVNGQSVPKIGWKQTDGQMGYPRNRLTVDLELLQVSRS